MTKLRRAPYHTQKDLTQSKVIRSTKGPNPVYISGIHYKEGPDPVLHLCTLHLGLHYKEGPDPVLHLCTLHLRLHYKEGPDQVLHLCTLHLGLHYKEGPDPVLHLCTPWKDRTLATARLKPH